MTLLFDSSVWVSYFQFDDIHHEDALALVENAVIARDRILVPEIVYVEVLNNLWRLTKNELEVAKCKAVFYRGSPLVKLLIGNEAFWFSTVERNMKKVNLKTSDLIIAAHAVNLGVDRFETFDKPLRREIDKILK